MLGATDVDPQGDHAAALGEVHAIDHERHEVEISKRPCEQLRQGALGGGHEAPRDRRAACALGCPAHLLADRFLAHAVASRREAGQHALHGQAVKHLDRGEELVAWQGKLAVGAGRAYPRALHDQAPAAEGDAARLAAVTVARTSLVVLALGPAEALHVLGEHRLHDLQAGAHGESQQALLGRGGDPTQADRQLLGQLDLDAGVRGVHLIALLHGGLPLVELLCGCPTPTTGRHQAGDRHPSSSTTFGTSSFAMVEGNPRWLIGIGLRLLAEQRTDGLVSPSVQTREVKRAASRFRALLRTIPVPDGARPTQRGLLSALDLLGKYIHEQVVLGDFTRDPVGSFIVDAHAPRWLLEVVGRSLNAGALIYIPDGDGEMLLSSLRGKRFRLSYLFAPYYGIPIRLGRAVSVMRALEIAARSADDTQESLLK